MNGVGVPVVVPVCVCVAVCDAVVGVGDNVLVGVIDEKNAASRPYGTLLGEAVGWANAADRRSTPRRGGTAAGDILRTKITKDYLVEAVRTFRVQAPAELALWASLRIAQKKEKRLERSSGESSRSSRKRKDACNGASASDPDRPRHAVHPKTK